MFSISLDRGLGNSSPSQDLGLGTGHIWDKGWQCRHKMTGLKHDGESQEALGSIDKLGPGATLLLSLRGKYPQEQVPLCLGCVEPQLLTPSNAALITLILSGYPHPPTTCFYLSYTGQAYPGKPRLATGVISRSDVRHTPSHTFCSPLCRNVYRGSSSLARRAVLLPDARRALVC